MPVTDFQLEADDRARAWIEAHPAAVPLVIAYDARWCCGGAKICSVTVRELSRRDHPEDYITGTLQDGTRLLIDRRAAKRLPRLFGLTVRGLGPFKHLDLALSGEQWGDLLYT